MTKRRVWITLICCSAAAFLALFVSRVIAVIRIFDNPEDFNLLPVLWAFISLVLLAMHFGLYVMVMDKTDRKHVVVDDEKWWERWDRV